MIEVKGDLFTYYKDNPCDAIVITTNGFVKANGRAVMGRGCAKEALSLMPEIDKKLGDNIARMGNMVSFLRSRVISFPVKGVSKLCTNENDYVGHMNFKIGDTIPGWACKAELSIIERSANELVSIVPDSWKDIIIPRPGCGAGELRWSEVKEVLGVLDDRFKVITW